MPLVLEKVLQTMFNTFSTWWMLLFFCPGNKCEVRESGLCSLPGVNMSRAGHAPEMCFLKHLYIEYLTSSRPGELNQQGITGSFLEPDTSAAARQWWGVLHVQNCPMEKCCITVHQHFPSDTSWWAWATLHFQTIKCISKNVKGAVIEGNKIATTSHS